VFYYNLWLQLQLQFFKYKYEKVNIGLAVVCGGSWCLIIFCEFLQFPTHANCVSYILRRFWTQSLYEAGIINSQIALNITMLQQKPKPENRIYYVVLNAVIIKSAAYTQKIVTLKYF